MIKKRQSRTTKIVLASLLAASLSVPSFASAKEAEVTTVKATVVAQEDFGYEEVTFETFKSGSDVAGYMDKYFEGTGLLIEDEDGTYFVTLTVPVEFASVVQGFEVVYEGEYVEAGFEEQEDGSMIIAFPVNPSERTAAKVHVVVAAIKVDAWYDFDFQPVVAEDEEAVEESLATITNPFSDIDNNENKEAILNLLALDIVKAQDKFNPNSNLTRAQFALMIARTLELKSTTDAGFQDVKGLDAERVSAINALAEYGIIEKRDKFNPNATLTRQQGALMIYRAIQAVMEDELVISTSLPYADVATIANDEAKKAFSLLYTTGVMTGSVAADGKTYINANKPLTRGQMAKLLNNSLALFYEEE